MAGSIDIVIVNWNTGDYLRQCLESVVEASRGDVRLDRVTVIDNDSSDGSAANLGELPLPLEVVRNSSNIGFAAACNQGAEGSTADYLLFLNPDTRLLPDTLARVSDFMDSERASGIGICGAQVTGPDGEPAISCARFPTLRIMVGKLTGLAALAPQAFPTHHLTLDELRTNREVDQVIGAFFLVRADLFRSLGGFDARYFLYFEEVDLSLRARRRGFRSYYLADARVIHVANVSSEKAGALRLRHSLRSRLIYARRHWPTWQLAALIALTFAIELPARLLVAAVRGGVSELGGTASAYARVAADLVRGLPGDRDHLR